ncbi:MAG TPA: response regulator transcription factor [Candidatus Dormibacteraeota bacterium]|jgi:DNA-binding NarL/FixJ family response regulator
MAEKLRVIIAEDNYLVREGTRRLLEDSDEVDVVAAVSNAVELLDAVERMRPHVVITDIRMPPDHHLEGIEAARVIRARHPDVGVVVLSQHSDDLYAYELLKDGTAGLAYLLKERVSELDMLVRTLKEVAAGGSVIDAKVVEALLGRRARREASALSSLTPREVEVLAKMAEGLTNPSIARALFMSESTVEKHVSAILSKLGLSEEKEIDRRVAAVLAYLREADSVT